MYTCMLLFSYVKQLLLVISAPFIYFYTYTYISQVPSLFNFLSFLVFDIPLQNIYHYILYYIYYLQEYKNKSKIKRRENNLILSSTIPFHATSSYVCNRVPISRWSRYVRESQPPGIWLRFWWWLRWWWF